MKKPFAPTWFDYFVSTCIFLLTLMFCYPIYADNIGLLAIIIPTLLLVSWLVFRKLTKKVRERNRIIKTQFPDEWREILEKKVRFYASLTPKYKKQFEYEINLFLAEKKITGIDTNIDDTDRLLVASSAVIPVFSFPNWNYDQLDEVIIYPNSFNHSFETAGEDRNISGMVGNGTLNGKMILSKKDLHFGFEHPQNKNNVGIHEFVHLIDESDGAIDGIPEVLMEHQYAKPWLKAIKEEITKIHQNKSDINPYGGVSEEEFLPVVSEYFFQRPKLFKRKHPKLYNLLNKVFQQDPVNQFKSKVAWTTKK